MLEIQILTSIQLLKHNGKPYIIMWAKVTSRNPFTSFSLLSNYQCLLSSFRRHITIKFTPLCFNFSVTSKYYNDFDKVKFLGCYEGVESQKYMIVSNLREQHFKFWYLYMTHYSPSTSVGGIHNILLPKDTISQGYVEQLEYHLTWNKTRQVY